FLVVPPASSALSPLSLHDALPILELIVARLRERGYLDEGLVTGGLYSDYLGQRVAAFQADRGLEVDGILGYKTLLQLQQGEPGEDRKSTRLNSSHVKISYAVFCLK